MLVAQVVSNGVDLGSCTEQRCIVAVSLQVCDGDEEVASQQKHIFSSFFIGEGVAMSSLHEVDEVGDIVGHLGSGGWGSIFVFEHPVVELSGHTEDHMVIVGVEVFSFGDVHAIWGLEVVACHDVVDIVDSSWSHSDLGEIYGPDTAVGIFCLILGEVGGVDMIVDEAITLIPLLIVILLEMVVSGMDSEVLSNPGGQFQLFVCLVKKQIVLFTHHTVAVCAVACEDLETYDKINKDLTEFCILSDANSTKFYLFSHFRSPKCP